MKLERLKNTRYPIIYMAICFLISSISFTYYDFNIWLVLIITSLFFLFVSFRESFEFSIALIIIFILGIVININFYNLKINNVEVIKINKIYNTFALGEIKGREISIEGNLKDMIEGSEIVAKGIFKNEINKEKGKIGTFKIEEFKINEKSIFTILAKFREEVKAKLVKNVGLRKAALISSIVFGKDSYLDSEDEEDMRTLGVVHAMSVSGLHIALLFLIIKKLGGIQLGILGSLIYVLITGIGFSSLRAWLMLSIIAMATILRKNENSISALFFSIIIIFFWKPYCIFQIGFQLSYGATLGILLFNKKINDSLYRLNVIIREGISLSLSSQIFIFPFLIIYFNKFSVGFILGNILLVPVINLILIFGIIGTVFYKIDILFDFISYVLIKLVEVLDNFMRALKSLELGEIYLGETVGYFYIVVLLSYYLYKKQVKNAKYIPIPFMIVMIVNLYSPIPKIEYRKEGAIVISYKGEKIFMTNNKKLDIKEMENKTGAKNHEGKNINIKNRGVIEREGKDFILKMKNKNYYLDMTIGKNNYDYDIINFKDGKEKKLKLITDKAIVIE